MLSTGGVQLCCVHLLKMYAVMERFQELTGLLVPCRQEKCLNFFASKSYTAYQLHPQLQV